MPPRSSAKNCHKQRKRRLSGVAKPCRSDKYRVASYNMSFASDLGKVMGSEGHFIQHGLHVDKHSVDKRYKQSRLWDNARHFVHHFWSEHEDAAVMGCQEMNDADLVNRTKPPNDPKARGYQSIIRLVQDVIGSKNTGYAHYQTPFRFGSPAVLTVWDKRRLGEALYVFGHDLQEDRHMPEKVGNLVTAQQRDPSVAGRPALVVITSKGFMLINLHAPNDPKDSNVNGMKTLRSSLLLLTRRVLSNFHLMYGKKHKIHQDRVFVMGDFNDPHHAINDDARLKLSMDTRLFHGPSCTDSDSDFEKQFEVTTGRKEHDRINSCCYNFNSACDESLFHNHAEPLQDDERGYGTVNGYECKTFKDERTGYKDMIFRGLSDMFKPAGQETRHYPGRGSLQTYRFTGDYCLGRNVVEKLQTFRPHIHNGNVSLESDHEMVMAVFRA